MAETTGTTWSALYPAPGESDYQLWNNAPAGAEWAGVPFHQADVVVTAAPLDPRRGFGGEAAEVMDGFAREPGVCVVRIGGPARPVGEDWPGRLDYFLSLHQYVAQRAAHLAWIDAADRPDLSPRFAVADGVTVGSLSDEDRRQALEGARAHRDARLGERLAANTRGVEEWLAANPDHPTARLARQRPDLRLMTALGDGETPLIGNVPASALIAPPSADGPLPLCLFVGPVDDDTASSFDASGERWLGWSPATGVGSARLATAVGDLTNYGALPTLEFSGNPERYRGALQELRGIGYYRSGRFVPTGLSGPARMTTSSSDVVDLDEFLAPPQQPAGGATAGPAPMAYRPDSVPGMPAALARRPGPAQPGRATPRVIT